MYFRIEVNHNPTSDGKPGHHVLYTIHREDYCVLKNVFQEDAIEYIHKNIYDTDLVDLSNHAYFYYSGFNGKSLKARIESQGYL